MQHEQGTETHIVMLGAHGRQPERGSTGTPEWEVLPTFHVLNTGAYTYKYVAICIYMRVQGYIYMSLYIGMSIYAGAPHAT